jgi:hypothetical protein
MQTSPRIAVSGAVIGAALSLFTPSTLAQPPEGAEIDAGSASPSLAAGLKLSSKRELAVAQRSPRWQMTASRTAWTMGASFRLMRPHDVAGRRRGSHAIAPWLGGDLLYVRTGGLDLAGFAAVAGLAPLDQRRRSWIGPFVRYYQIDHAGFDNRDAKILTVGIGLEIGTGIDRRRERLRAVALASAALPGPFADRDGVADGTDGAPDQAWHP